MIARVPALLLALALAPAAAYAAVPAPGGPAASRAAEVADPAELDIQSRLMAPCCWTGTLADHDSELVQEMKLEIRERLAAGETPDAIVAGFVAEYGERVLAAPPARGLSMLPYLLPVAALLGGGLVLGLWLRRQTAAARAEDAAPRPLEEEDLRRVESWLQEPAD